MAKHSALTGDEAYVLSQQYTDSQLIGAGNVTGVKGDAETSYRAGTVNLTPENIGAYSKVEVDAAVRQVSDKADENQANIQTLQTAVAGLDYKVNSLAKCYGMHINGNESNPASMITYLADAVGMTPAHMDYTNNQFDYGSWKETFALDEKPCVLNSDGTVYCYLNPNDLTKDADGNDVTDVVDGITDFGQNVMVEFPKIWMKIVPDADDAFSASAYFSQVKLDDGYKDYAYIDKNGNHKEHFYMPCYNGSLVNGTMRSLSGKQVSKTLTGQQEIDACVANGNGWYTEDAGEVMLINFLLMLISKSTDTQTVFGQGLHTGGSEAINDAFRTGIHNDKGMFYGTNSGAAATYTNAVKCFYVENWYGFQWRRYAGDILDNGILKQKLCWGTEDGSTVNDFNLTGSGYVTIPDCTPSGANGGYISQMKFTEKGMFSKVSSGSSSTYYCDGQWYNNSDARYAIRGGDSRNGLLCGALCVTRVTDVGVAAWSYGAAISYKELHRKGEFAQAKRGNGLKKPVSPKIKIDEQP